MADMFTRRFVVALVVVFLAVLVFPVTSQAQFGAIKRFGVAVADTTAAGVSGAIEGVRNNNSDNNEAVEVSEAPPAKPATATSVVKRRNVRDKEAAVIETALSIGEASEVVRSYFNDNDIDFEVNTDTNRINTDWYGERRCGIGWNRCANRAMVRVVPEGNQTTLRVQVFERKREAGINNKPWKEESNSKGRETSELAEKLEELLASARVSPVSILADASTASAAPLPTPAPVSAASKTITLDQTPGDVESVLGSPTTIIDLGQRKTYVYPDMRVIFTDGKVSDVQ